MRVVARTLQEGGLYVLLFLLPFSKAAVEIAFGVIGCGWVLERLHPATRADTGWLRPALRPLRAAGAVFLGACVLSLLASTDPGLSLQGLTRPWLESLVLFMIITDVGRRPGVAQRSLGVLAVSALLVVIEGMFQERYGSGLLFGSPQDSLRRMTGPYETSRDLATYLMVIFPLMSTYALLKQGTARWRVWGLSLVLILCLALASSVSAWFGLGAGVLVLSRWRTAMRRSALTVLAVALLATGAFLVGTNRLPLVLSATDVRKLPRERTAIGMIADRPILGRGVNTFMAGNPLPHNGYLRLWAEMGLVGLGAFLWLLWGLVGLWRRAVPWISDGPPHDMLLGLLAGLVAFLAQAVIDANFYAARQACLFWSLAGLATGLAISARLDPRV